MAAVTLLRGATSTAQAASYGPTTAVTPTANMLLVGVVSSITNTASDWVLADSLGGTWTKIDRALAKTSADFLEFWVRTTLVPASSMTCTYSHATGNAQGNGILILGVTSMTLTGASAIRSGNAKQENQAASGTPAPTLGQAALTANPVVTVVLNGSNPDGVTVPSTWTDLASATNTTPSWGMRAASVNSGFTGTTVTWGSTSATAFASLVFELDTSAGGGGGETDFMGDIPI